MKYISDYLLETAESVCLVLSNENVALTPEQLNRCIVDKSFGSHVRINLAKRIALIKTEAHINSLLGDEDHEVAIAVLKNSSIKLSNVQYKKCMASKSMRVRTACLERYEFVPQIYQVDSFIKKAINEQWSVLSLLNHPGVMLNVKQANALFNSNILHLQAKIDLVNKGLCIPSDEDLAVVWGMNLQSARLAEELVNLCLQKFSDRILSDDQIRFLSRQNSTHVLVSMLKMPRITLPSEVLNYLSYVTMSLAPNDLSENFKKYIARKESEKLKLTIGAAQVGKKLSAL